MSIGFLAGNRTHKSAMACAKVVCDSFYNMTAPRILRNNPALIRGYSAFKSLFYCFKIPKHKAYFVHGPTGLFLGVLKKCVRKEGCKLIMRVNTRMFSDYDMSPLKKWLLKSLYKHLDGCIAVSEMIKQEILSKVPNMPVRVYNTPLNDLEYFSINPDFKSKNVMCLGVSRRLRKGIDIQLKVFEHLKNNATMFILGDISEIENKYLNVQFKNEYIDTLFFTGKVNPKEYMKECLFLLHPARYDACPNAVVEAMASGLIPIVSSMTGNKELVAEVDPYLVVEGFDYADYLQRINDLNSLSEETLRFFSAKCKSVIMRLNRLSKGKFKELFEELINIGDE